MAVSGRGLSFDRRAVLEGAGLALAVTLPPVVLVRILHGDDLDGRESNLWIVTLLAVFAGFALGGHRAAKLQPRTGLAHAAAAAGLAFAVVAVYSLIRQAVAGDGVSVSEVLRLFVVGSITVSLGILGGYVAVRRSP